MGRSQRRKILSQGLAADGELWAEGVGTVPAATTHDLGFPNNAGVPPDVPPQGGSGRSGIAALEVTPETSPVVYGSSGGPLQGSIVQGPASEGGTAPLPPEGGDGGEVEPGPGEAPTITSLTPDTVEVNTGTELTITGTGFDDQTGVVVNEGQLVSAFVSETEMTASVPGLFNAGVADLYVRNANGQSNTVQLTVTDPARARRT